MEFGKRGNYVIAFPIAFVRIVLKKTDGWIPSIGFLSDFLRLGEQPAMVSTMNPIDQSVLSAFAARIRQSLPHAALWAFGSRARGDATAESDLDICVVVDHLDRSTRSLIRQVAWEIGFANDVVITTVKYSKDAFEKGPSSVSPLVQSVLREGIPA